MFQDITTLLLDPKVFKDTIDLFVERYKSKNISVVAGVEARGFIFGPPIALAIGAKFVPLRKPKKLPGKVFRQEYDLEYGSDCLEMHVGAVAPGERALVVDDLIATGGTLCAAMDLLERAGAEVLECACVIEIPALKGRERLNGKPTVDSAYESRKFMVKRLLIEYISSIFLLYLSMMRRSLVLC
ncbi:Adenine phosphoribosyltransferase 3 [Sesamum angolense]|uniref:adenine phosphoribosyltransferase n=1 Tax=Sesamum angolense TaxID=2727404 RepID=A0AAE1W9W2_9LAMI|nr:Adenine phosphoribosyltransferase 3 [Sesamum angolense]